MGEVFEREGSRTEFLAEHEQIAVFEFMRAGGRPGANHHFHAKHVDSFIVLEGELEVLTAGDPLTLQAGEAVAVPPGVVHGFNNRSSEELRLINVHAPSQRFGEYLRRQFRREETDSTEFDQYPPEDAPGGDPLVVRLGGGERFERENRVITIRYELPQLSLVEIEFDPSFEVPPHVHHDHTDSFYVLDGEVEFTNGETVTRARPGTFFSAPPGTRHGFRNGGDSRARVLNLHAPDAGFAASIRDQ